jgi:chromate reductase, NAD(P)H dehydrogenase (quinone)
MKILVISGSLKLSSSNTMLVRAIVKLAPADLEFTLYDGLGDLPHFSPDIDNENAPSAVVLLRNLVQTSDGVLLCTPEYAYGMPGSLKNALDWLVSSGALMEKPVATITAAPNAGGGEKAHAALRLTLTALLAKLTEDNQLTIPLVRTKVSAEGVISDPALTQALYAILISLSKVIKEGED